MNEIEEVDGVSVVLGDEVVILVVAVEVSLGNGSSVCSVVFSTVVCTCRRCKGCSRFIALNYRK